MILTNNIIFQNFKKKKNINSLNKKLNLILQKKNEILKSMTPSYQYSFSSKLVTKFRKFTKIRQKIRQIFKNPANFQKSGKSGNLENLPDFPEISKFPEIFANPYAPICSAPMCPFPIRAHKHKLFKQLSKNFGTFSGRCLGTFWACPGPGTGPKCSPKT